MSLVYQGSVEMKTGGIRFSIASDFCKNCLTADPYSHSHPKFELHLALEGNFFAELEKDLLPFSRGDFLLLPPHLPHRILAQDPNGATLSLLLEGKDEKKLPPLLQNTQAAQVISDTFGGKEILLSMQRELKERSPFFEDMIDAKMLTLFAHLGRMLGEEPPEESHLEEGYAEKIERYLIEHRFDPEASCEKLAKELHLSTRQVHRLCVKFFHASFRDLMTDARMESAAYRLRTTDVRITKLAEEMGYSGVASFSAAYKRHFGVSPTKDTFN